MTMLTERGKDWKKMEEKEENENAINLGEKKRNQKKIWNRGIQHKEN